jgi:heptosyltransferase-2
MSTVIRSPNWIGDGIMSLPAIRAFRDLFPNERLAVAAKDYLAPLFQNIPEIDEIVPLPDRWTAPSLARAASDLRRRGFARGLLFTNSFSSALLFRLAGIRPLAGYARDGRSLLLQQRFAPPPPSCHHRHYYLHLVERLAGRNAGRAYPADLAVSAAEREAGAAWLREQGIGGERPLLAVAPAAAFGGAKAWPPGRFREFIAAWLRRRPQSTVLLLGSAAERERIAGIAAGLPAGAHNLAGRLDLRRSIAVLSRCRLFVGNDSGLMHVASALAVPLVAVFGPTEPGRTAPVSGRFRLLHHGADCAPCRHRECPTDHRCMSAVAAAEVLEAAESLWENGNA